MEWYEKITLVVMILCFIFVMRDSWRRSQLKDEITVTPTQAEEEKGFPKDCTEYSLQVSEDFDWPEGAIGMSLEPDCTLKFHYTEDIKDKDAN